jgi:hypothetical protein
MNKTGTFLPQRACTRSDAAVLDIPSSLIEFQHCFTDEAACAAFLFERSFVAPMNLAALGLRASGDGRLSGAILAGSYSLSVRAVIPLNR